MAPKISVVDPKYCNRSEMVVVLLALANGNIAVVDVNRRIDAMAEDVHRPLARNLGSIHDAAGNPIVTLKPKFWTAHGRWEVFRGDSREPRDLIFTAKKHSIVNLKTNLDVFLASNSGEERPDFEVKGNFSEKSYTIYAGDVVIARLQKTKLPNVDSILQGDDNIMVTISPNVDYIFVVALYLILGKISSTFKFIVKPAVSSVTFFSSVISIVSFAVGQDSNS